MIRPEYIGRIDEQVKIRGFRIELGEIEAKLLNIKTITQASVLVKEENNNKTLVAYIVSKVKNIDINKIKEDLAKELPSYMIPSAYKTLEKLPLTPNGKVDKKALLNLEVNITSTTKYEAPKTKTQKDLVKIFSEVLNIKADIIGINDNFFDLGGHSLLATRLVSSIRTNLKVELPLKTLFESSNIKALETYINNSTKTKLSKIPKLKDKSNIALSFAQERLWFLNQFEKNSTNYNMPAVLNLKGTLNIKALNKAFETIVTRHESLRTNFVQKENNAIQIINDIKDFEVEYKSINEKYEVSHSNCC